MLTYTKQHEQERYSLQKNRSITQSILSWLNSSLLWPFQSENVGNWTADFWSLPIRLFIESFCHHTWIACARWLWKNEWYTTEERWVLGRKCLTLLSAPLAFLSFFAKKSSCSRIGVHLIRFLGISHNCCSKYVSRLS